MAIEATTLSDLLTAWTKSSQRCTWTDVLRRADTDEKRRVARQAVDELADHSPLDGLTANRELVEALAHGRWHVMRDAREAGHSWAEIGEALAMTRQAAQQMYARACEGQETLRGRSYGPTDDDMHRYRAALQDDEDG